MGSRRLITVVDVDTHGSTIRNLAVGADRSRLVTLHVAFLAGTTAISRLAVRSAGFSKPITVHRRLFRGCHGKNMRCRIN